ncbi:MAG: DUF4185 domain-containing protein [Planctomycetes bacterium]|nr:DUF4185 domain-containing protein [Planctomycetota bacterium]
MLRFMPLGILLFGIGPPHAVAARPQAPYKASGVIRDVSFDFSTLRRLAPGSDNWPITWADDDHQYTSWGDGGGFGGTNERGRASLGFARVEGSSKNHRGINIWGGHRPAVPARFGGKSYGILSVDGVLYAWWGRGSGAEFVAETRVLRSTDRGKTWTPSRWRFTKDDSLYAGTFCNFGKDYAGARDSYVYCYFPRGTKWAINKPGRVDLARVPKSRIMNREAYEFFAGATAQGKPTWSRDIAARRPVFEDPNGLRTASVSYNAGLKRYLLTSEHTEAARGNLAIFDAPEPWGPWTTIAYEKNWGKTQGTISFYFSNKWTNKNGRDFTMVFTDRDHWATVRGRFHVRAERRNAGQPARAGKLPNGPREQTGLETAARPRSHDCAQNIRNPIPGRGYVKRSEELRRFHQQTDERTKENGAAGPLWSGRCGQDHAQRNESKKIQQRVDLPFAIPQEVRQVNQRVII